MKVVFPEGVEQEAAGLNCALQIPPHATAWQGGEVALQHKSYLGVTLLL